MHSETSNVLVGLGIASTTLFFGVLVAYALEARTNLPPTVRLAAGLAAAVALAAVGYWFVLGYDAVA
jgi:hypothetical protein